MRIANQSIDQRWIDERSVGTDSHDRRRIGLADCCREARQRIALLAEKCINIRRQQWRDNVVKRRIGNNEYLIDAHGFGHAARDPLEQRLVAELSRTQRVSHRRVGERGNFDNAKRMRHP